MRYLRTLFGLLLIVGVCIGFTACDSDDDEATSTLISSFYLLSPDSIEAIEDAVFYINADTTFIYNGVTYEGFIQNRDSMAYGTDLSKVVPVISSLSIISTILSDTITYSSEDTLDFTSPMKVLVYAQDITISQLYLAKGNVHQIDEQLYKWDQRVYPEFSYISGEQAMFYGDSLLLFVIEGSSVKLQKSGDKANTWLDEAVVVSSLPTECVGQIVVGGDSLYASNGTELYVSADGREWTASSMGSYTVQRMLFNTGERTFALTTDNAIIATSDGGANWEKVRDCESDFPYVDFDIVTEKTPSGKMQYALVGGESQDGTAGGVWATENGEYWVNFSRDSKDMKSRSNAAAVAYDHKLFIFGGEENGVLADSILMSPNFGLSWGMASMKVYPPYYVPTTNANVFVDDEYRLFMIGGKNASGNFTKTIYTGRKNETYFKEYE